MELMWIGLFGGFLFAGMFIAIGIVLGRTVSEKELSDSTDNDYVPNICDNDSDSIVGKLHRKLFNRRNMGVDRVEEEEIINILWNIYLSTKPLSDKDKEGIIKTIKYIGEKAN